MHINLVFLLVILFDIKDYTYAQKETETPKSDSQTSVVFSSQRLDETLLFADCLDPPTIECASLQGQAVPTQTQSSDDGGCDYALALPLVQKTQQVLCDEVRIVLFELGKVHRYSLCPWAKAASSGFTEGVFTEEVVAAKRLDSMGQFYNYPSQAGCVTTKTPQDSEKNEGAEGKLWNTSAGPALAVFSAGTHALADYAGFYGVNASHDFARVGHGDRAVRSTSSRRNPSGGRQGQETARTASYCKISEAGLRQAGEETQNSQSCHGGKKEVACLLGQLYRGVHLTMEAVCRRFYKQRPGFGEEGERSSRSRPGCPQQIRCGKGGERQAGCGCAGGRGRDLRCDGRGAGRQDCLCGGYQSRDPVGSGWLRELSSHPLGNASRSYSAQKAEDRRWRRRSTWSWLFCVEAFSSARQIDLWKEVCLGQTPACFEQPDHLVHQWTHSILEEPTFLNEWKPGSQALELAFQVSMMNVLTFAGKPAVHTCDTKQVKPCISNRSVSFCDTVELYVGPEHDRHLQMWRQRVDIPISQSRLFRPLGHLLGDEVSFMAMGNRFPQHGLHDEPTPIVEDRQIARELDESDQEMEVEVELEQPDAESSDDEPSHEQDWFATLIFAIDFQPPTPLRVDWNDYETMHSGAAEILGVTRHQLLTLHHVGTPPEDFHDAGVEALIGHRHDDLEPGSTYRLVLIDVEFHSATPEEQPEVVRRAARVPRQIGRLTLLNRLGLNAYCRATSQSCTLWRNGEMASRYSALPLDINHGDYLRVVVPAGDHVASHIGTRCVASACQQGITLSEICDRHALFVLGWYDTIIGQPLVPLRLDGDGSSLLQQLTATPPLPVSPWFLLKRSFCKINTTVPTDHYETDFRETTRSMADSAPPTLPGGMAPRPGIDEQPEHIQNLLGQLEQDGALEVEEEGQVLYVNAWFLNYPEHERCLEYRTVRIAGDFEHWNQQFTRAWRDRIEPGIPVHFHLVHPQPPTSRMQPMVLPHVILMQRAPEEGRAAVITLLDSRGGNDGFQPLCSLSPSYHKQSTCYRCGQQDQRLHSSNL